MKTEDLINQFSNYLFGFEFINDKTLYSELLNGKDLLPIFTDKSGSVVCLWKCEGVEKLVWIDSEGTPCNAFAKNIEDFFEILPYGPNFIWDYLSKHQNHLISPNLIPNPETIFTLKYITENYIDNIEDKALFDNYCDWLDENNLSFNTDPIKKIKDVISNSVFLDWFTN